MNQVIKASVLLSVTFLAACSGGNAVTPPVQVSQVSVESVEALPTRDIEAVSTAPVSSDLSAAEIAELGKDVPFPANARIAGPPISRRVLSDHIAAAVRSLLAVRNSTELRTQISRLNAIAGSEVPRTTMSATARTIANLKILNGTHQLAGGLALRQAVAAQLESLARALRS